MALTVTHVVLLMRRSIYKHWRLLSNEQNKLKRSNSYQSVAIHETEEFRNINRLNELGHYRTTA